MSAPSQAVRPSKLVLPKPLSQYHPLDLAKQLKGHRVQMKHLIRCELAGFLDVLLPTGKINPKTNLSKYQYPCRGMEKFQKKLNKSLYKRYRRLHPQHRHVQFGEPWSLDPEAAALYEALQEEDHCEYYYDPDAYEDDDSEKAERLRAETAQRSLLQGAIAMPVLSGVRKQCHDFIDAFPDSDSAESDSSESESEHDEDDPCEVCFNVPNDDDASSDDAPDSDPADPAGSLETATRDQMPSDQAKVTAADVKTDSVPERVTNVDNVEELVSEPPRKKAKTDRRPQPRCSRGRRGCRSNHDEASVARHLPSFQEILKEFCDQADKAKLRGAELMQLQDELDRQKHQHAMAYAHLSKCCEAVFCKTKPHGSATYQGISLKKKPASRATKA